MEGVFNNVDSYQNEPIMRDGGYSVTGQNIVEKYQYQDFDDMFKHYQQLINQCKVQFDNYVTGKYNIYAFYNNCDMNYCEDCEEDLQIFYSFIVLQNNEVYYKLPIID